MLQISLNMRLFLIGISISLFLLSCSQDESLDIVEPLSCDDYSSANDTCLNLTTLDSSAFVAAHLGSWYLEASQASGFGGGDVTCFTFNETTSPFKFIINRNGTWRHITDERDTVIQWVTIKKSTGWQLISLDTQTPIPTVQYLCDRRMVRDLRPLDGGLAVFVKE